jgi:energy-coupling factor transporter ATP-binding protein EcfA2
MFDGGARALGIRHMTDARSEVIAARFRSVEFGETSAEEERRNPKLLTEGYVDALQSLRAIYQEQRFIIFGRKGSGKSSLAEHLRRTAESRHDRFVTLIDAEAFMASVSDGDERLRSQGARWAMLIDLFVSIRQDQDAYERSGELREAYRLLEGRRLLVPSRLSRLLNRNRITVRDPVSRSIELVREVLDDDIRSGEEGSALFRQLLERVQRADLTNWHFLFIDGLEHLDVRLATVRFDIAVVLRAVEAINKALILASVPCRIVVLIRPDIFDRLDDLTDKGKLARVAGHRLEWHSPHGLGSGSSLGALVDRRAALSLDRRAVVAHEFLSWTYRGRRAHEALVAHTRSTPRDVVALLGQLKSASTGSGLTGTALGRALRGYAADYLSSEINDEIDLHVPLGTRRACWRALRDLHDRVGEVTLDELIGRCPESVNARLLLEALYDCGAVGQRLGRSGKPIFRFVDLQFEPDWDRQFTLHPGVALALRR